MLSIVLVCALLTYGGVSLFVVVFAVYPFAAELFRQGHIPKRLIPGTIALGAFTFTMDALPGTPQIQNIIPDRVLRHQLPGRRRGSASIGAVFILVARPELPRMAPPRGAAAGEGYGEGHTNEPARFAAERLANPLIALLPLLVWSA